MMILVITNNDFVNLVFDKVRYTLDTKTQTGMRRTDDGKLVPRYFPEWASEMLNKSEELYKNAQESYDIVDWIRVCKETP